MTAAAALLERVAADPGRRDRDRQPVVPPTRSRPTASSTSSGPATRGSRSRRCSRATARIPGFNPIVELSMTFHTQVVGANGQRQAMFIERTPGLAEVILSNFTFGAERRHDRLLGRRHDRRPGRDGPRRATRGLRVIAVTSVAQSLSAELDPRRRQPPPRRGRPRHRPVHARTRTPCSTIAGLDTPVGPGSTIAAVAHRQRHQGPDGRAPAERGAMPPVLTRAASSASERSRACSTTPTESMRGGSPVRSTNEEVGDAQRRADDATGDRSVRPGPTRGMRGRSQRRSSE